MEEMWFKSLRWDMKKEKSGGQVVRWSGGHVVEGGGKGEWG